MALVLPGKVPSVRKERDVHPAICLLAGFALIAAMATGVHILFGFI